MKAVWRWNTGMVHLPTPTGAWVQDDDGMWRELYTPRRRVNYEGVTISEERWHAPVRVNRPLGRKATALEVARCEPRLACGKPPV